MIQVLHLGDELTGAHQAANGRWPLALKQCGKVGALGVLPALALNTFDQAQKARQQGAIRNDQVDPARQQQTLVAIAHGRFQFTHHNL